MPRSLGIATGAALVLAFALAVAYSITRSPWWDEGLYADTAQRFARHGTLGNALMGPNGTFGGAPLPRMDERTYWTTPLYPVVLGAWFRALGAGLLQMRALSVVLTAVLVWAWGGIVRALTGSRAAALVAMALIALDSHVLWSASMGRTEALSSGLGAVAVLAYLRWREQRLTRAVGIASALLAAGALAHPLAAVEGAGLAALALVLDRRRLRPHHVAVALGVGLAVVAPWLAYVLQDVDVFRGQWAANMAGRDGGLAHPLRSLATDLRDRYLHHHFTAVRGITRARVLGLVALAGCFGVALGVPWVRRRRGLAPLAAFALASWAALAVLDGSRYVQYFSHVFPAYLAVAGVAVAALLAHSTPARVAGLGLAAGLVGPGVGGIVHRAAQNPYATEYLPVIDAVRKHRTPGGVVIGGSELGFVLGFDRTVVDDMKMRRRADVYVQNELYLTDANGKWQRQLRAELARDFVPVLKNSRYKVFVRRPAAAPGAGH